MPLADVPMSEAQLWAGVLGELSWDPSVDVTDVDEQWLARLVAAFAGTGSVRAVRRMLAWDVAGPDSRSTFTTTASRITVEGELGTWHERDAVDEAIPTG